MIEVKGLSKIYPTKEREFVALKDVSLKITKGEFVAVLGESGSGKTTFLNMLSGIDIKTSGEICFNGKNTDKFNDLEWRKLRNSEIGFIFQRFNLIDHLTVMENVILPLILTGTEEEIASQLALKILKEVGLVGVENKLAKELSGGQRQRVAIARTIIINPTIILADEPTGALDSTTAKEIMALLQKFADGRIIILVTHDEDLAYKNANRVVRLHDGEVISDEVIKEKNKETASKAHDLIHHEVKLTRKIIKRIEKEHPELKGKYKRGDVSEIPLVRDYKLNNPEFTRKIARKNYAQKIKVNRRILLSFIISISMLLIVNVVMRNIANYNFNMFEINNNYNQFLVTDYDDQTIDDLLEYEYVEEANYYYTSFVQEMYLINDSTHELTSNVTGINNGIFSPKIVTLPEDESNYYLHDQIIAGDYPSDIDEIIVSSEFVISRFYGYSMNSGYNFDLSKPVSSLDDLVGSKLFICGETLITEDDIPSNVLIEDNCYEFVISGILNSYYKGIDYAGNIFVDPEGFARYISYLRDDKFFTRVDEYYDKYVSFYVSDSNLDFDISELEDELSISVINDELTVYLETRSLQVLLTYVYIAIFVALITISGTIDVNIVASSVLARIREIGIYSCIGVSKNSIRNMFVWETVLSAFRILLFNGLLIVLINVFFMFIYKNVVVDLTYLEPIFGSNTTISYELFVSLEILLGAVGFLFVSVLVPSFRAANMRAIDALRG